MKIFKNKHDHLRMSPLRLSRIVKEFRKGFKFINKFQKTVTFFGSARFPKGSPYYKQAEALAKKLAENGFTVITGGGPGIMEAANEGAVNGKGKSIGLNIQLPHEQRINPFVKEGMGFYYFFTRKVMLSFSAQAYIFFPGGYGTLDEFFELLVLVQTGKIKDKIPIILVGSEFWGTLAEWIGHILCEKLGTITHEDLDIWTLTDNIDDAADIIISSPERKQF